MSTSARWIVKQAALLPRRCACFRKQHCRGLASNEQDQLTLVHFENGIKKITLNDVKRRNALSYAMLSELADQITNQLDDPKLQVIVLASNGPAFSAGHNLKELQLDTGSSYHSQIFQKCSELMKLVQDVPVPVIAQVRGIATAAGCQLVASCDLAVASESSKFATPGVSIGLFCSTPAVALARVVPRKVAMKMLLTAEPITATEALQCGLINQISKDENLEAENHHSKQGLSASEKFRATGNEGQVQQLAEKICSFSKPVIGLGKKTFYQQIAKSRDSAYEMTEDVMVCNLTYPDAQEGIDAFISKRKPVWTQNVDS